MAAAFVPHEQAADEADGEEDDGTADPTARERLNHVALLQSQTWAISRVANPPGMGGRLPEFNSISRLPLVIARKSLISRNAPKLVLYSYIMVAY